MDVGMEFIGRTIANSFYALCGLQSIPCLSGGKSLNRARETLLPIQATELNFHQCSADKRELSWPMHRKFAQRSHPL
jgi:hypothetical protein